MVISLLHIFYPCTLKVFHWLHTLAPRYVFHGAQFYSFGGKCFHVYFTIIINFPAVIFILFYSIFSFFAFHSPSLTLICIFFSPSSHLHCTYIYIQLFLQRILIFIWCYSCYVCIDFVIDFAKWCRVINYRLYCVSCFSLRLSHRHSEYSRKCKECMIFDRDREEKL